MSFISKQKYPKFFSFWSPIHYYTYLIIKSFQSPLIWNKSSIFISHDPDIFFKRKQVICRLSFILNLCEVIRIMLCIFDRNAVEVAFLSQCFVATLIYLFFSMNILCSSKKALLVFLLELIEFINQGAEISSH